MKRMIQVRCRAFATLSMTAVLAASPELVSAQKPAPNAPAFPDAVAAAVGQIIYQRYCGSCHGPVGKGDGAIAKDLAVAPTDLTKLAGRNAGRFPFERVVRLIDGRERARGHGTADMPVWGEVFPRTEGTASPDVGTAVARITHYLWSIQVPATK